MYFEISSSKKIPSKGDLLQIGTSYNQLNVLSDDNLKLFKKFTKEAKKGEMAFSQDGRMLFVVLMKKESSTPKRLEQYRSCGHIIQKMVSKHKVSQLHFVADVVPGEEIFAFSEGLALANYQFLKYKKEASKLKTSLVSLVVISQNIDASDIEELNILVDAVYKCRTLVNEPVMYMTAMQLAKEITNMAKDTGSKIEVFNKKKIESLKMGGLLAVNKGSIDPPTFSIMEWKPKNYVNKKPIIFVGKGVVYDTGGLSLKPTQYMDTMKCDMAGSAMVSTALYAIAKAKLPVHVIALIPATDNRPDGNAYTPGDVIKMYDGTTVEVLNTDAEGRMILADALSYAKQFDPMLVIDAATLTGAASRAIGKYGIVAMNKNAEKYYKDLEKTGNEVWERLVDFPFWDDYDELIKSDIADIKNIGGADAGMITAGKFLAHFTDYPYIHLDIAGPAYHDKAYSYQGQGGSGIGVRLLYHFIKNFASKNK